MSFAIEEIKRFQIDRGLHLKKYVAINEHVNIIEELFESLGLNVPSNNREHLKQKWNDFCSECMTDKIVGIDSNNKDTLEIEAVDAYCDILVFSIGALMKLGYEPELVLQETAKEINSRCGEIINGKFEKNLSDEAKALWYKADYNKCKIN